MEYNTIVLKDRYSMKYAIFTNFLIDDLVLTHWNYCRLAVIDVLYCNTPDSKVHVANMGPIWGR